MHAPVPEARVATDDPLEAPLRRLDGPRALGRGVQLCGLVFGLGVEGILCVGGRSHGRVYVRVYCGGNVACDGTTQEAPTTDSDNPFLKIYLVELGEEQPLQALGALGGHVQQRAVFVGVL